MQYSKKKKKSKLKMSNRDWTFIEKNLTKLSLSSLKVIYEQSNTILENLTYIGESFRTRALGILGFVVAVLVSIIAYSYENLENTQLISILIITGIPLFIISVLCLLILQTKISGYTGCSAAELIKRSHMEYWITLTEPSDMQEKEIILNQLRANEEKTRKRLEQNALIGASLTGLWVFLYHHPC